MNSPLHILVTVRTPELLPAALLVFQTLRRGFPSAPVYVWGNNLKPEYLPAVMQAVAVTGGTFNNLQATCHDAWIEQLVLGQAQPFWICDTDMVFFDPVELFCDAKDTDYLLWRFEPTWHEPWTNTVHIERLHTCLQWFNPGALRGAIMRWARQNVPDVFLDLKVPWIRQHFIPRKGEKTLFYDSTAGIWHALGGRKFTATQNAAFEHLHCGTYSEAVGKCTPLKELPAGHAAIIANPELARGIQEQQDEFYATRAIKPARKGKRGLR